MCARSLLVDAVKQQPDREAAQNFLAAKKADFIKGAKNSIPDPKLPDDVVQEAIGKALEDIDALFANMKFDTDGTSPHFK